MTELQQLRKALARVRELHQPEIEGGQGYLADGSYGLIEPCCRTCGTADEYATPWPCATYVAANVGGV